MKLTNKDYLTILDYYNITPSQNSKGNLDRKKIKEEAEDILASKLCRCIKKIDPVDENKSIAICTDSIFTKRGIKYDAFKCSPAYTLLRTRKNRHALNKTRKKIMF